MYALCTPMVRHGCGVDHVCRQRDGVRSYSAASISFELKANVQFLLMALMIYKWRIRENDEKIPPL